MRLLAERISRREFLKICGGVAVTAPFLRVPIVGSKREAGASPQRLSPQLGVLITYDERMAKAATELGLPAHAPM